MELKIEHLSKQFKDKTAVNDVNLTLTPGICGYGGKGRGRQNLYHRQWETPSPEELAGRSHGSDRRERGLWRNPIFRRFPDKIGL